MRLFHQCPFKFVDCSGSDPRGRLVCLRGSLEKTPRLDQDSYFLCRSVIPEKRSRSSLAARSYIAQINGSKEREKLKELLLFPWGGKCSKCWLRAKCWPNEAWKANGWHWRESQTPSPSNRAELRLAPAEGEIIPFSKNIRTKVLTEKTLGEEM